MTCRIEPTRLSGRALPIQRDVCRRAGRRIVEGRDPVRTEEAGRPRLRSAIPIALRNPARLTGLATWPPACAGALPSRPSSPRCTSPITESPAFTKSTICAGFLSSFIFASLVPAPVPTTRSCCRPSNLISASFSLIVIELEANRRYRSVDRLLCRRRVQAHRWRHQYRGKKKSSHRCCNQPFHHTLLNVMNFASVSLPLFTSRNHSAFHVPS